MSTLPSQGDLQNVYFYYTRIAEPQQKWQTTEPTDREYVTTVVVSQEQYKQFTAQFPKKKTTPLTNDEFVEKFKSQPPFPEQPLQYVLKFKQRAFKKDGAPIAESLRPKVYQFIDNVQTDITTTLIGNGSKGTIRYSVWVPTNNPALGPAANLFAVLVTDLVPYDKPNPNAFTQE